METPLTKLEFLTQLEIKLAALPAHERQSALEYYKTFIGEADDEKTVIASLGSPGDVAAEIFSGYLKRESHGAPVPNSPPTPHFEQAPMAGASHEKAKGYKRYWWLIAILAILGAPVIIGLVAGIGGGLFGLFVGLASVIFAFAVSGVTFFVTGAASLVFSVFIFVQDIGFGLLSAGTGLLLMGIGILLMKLTVAVAKWIFALIQNMIRRLQNGRIKTAR